jgi:hypothetical protein
VFHVDDATTLCLRRRDDGLLKNGLKRLPGCVWKRFMGLKYALPELLEFVTGHVGFVDTVIRALGTRGMSGQECDYILRAFFKNCAEYTLLAGHLRPEEKVVVEEGFCQRAFTLFGYLDEDLPVDEIEAFADRMPGPQRVLWVDADPAVCEERLLPRMRDGLSRRLAALDRAGRISLLKHGRECLRALTARLQSLGIEVMRLDNNRSFEESADGIRQSAEHILGSRVTRHK